MLQRVGSILHAVSLATRATNLARRAERLASDEKYSEAVKLLKEMYDLIGGGVPSSRAPVEVNILTCQVGIGVADGPLALAAASIAKRQLSDGDRRYRDMDRRYLLAFARALENYCLRWLHGDAAQETPNSVDDISMQLVSRRLKLRFLMPPDGSYLDPVARKPSETVH